MPPRRQIHQRGPFCLPFLHAILGKMANPRIKRGGYRVRRMRLRHRDERNFPRFPPRAARRRLDARLNSLQIFSYRFARHVTIFILPRAVAATLRSG